MCLLSSGQIRAAKAAAARKGIHGQRALPVPRGGSGVSTMLRRTLTRRSSGNRGYRVQTGVTRPCQSWRRVQRAV